MVATRYGGETPLIKYGTELSAESLATTSAALPIEQGDLFKFGGTAADGTAFKLAACAAADDTNAVDLLMALHRCEKANAPVGVKVLNGSHEQIRRLRYDGAAPTLGQSVEIAAGNLRKVTGQAFAKGAGQVMAVNTATTEVEVLI